MMVQPFTGERYAGDGETAWCTRSGKTERLNTRSCGSLASATVFTTSPALFKGSDRNAYDRVESAVRLARYGCDCYAYCVVAGGHADIVIEADLKPYDIVALIPIVTGAGGRVTNWQGASAAAGGNIVASGDPELHDIVLARLADG